MNAVKKIREYIEQLPAGEIFAANALYYCSNTDNARQALHRLVKTGVIKKIARGVFMKPEANLKISAAMPSTTEIIESLRTITGETITVHGAEAARQLQLTTQMSMRPVFYTSGNTRTLKLANRTVELRHTSPKKLMLAGTFAGLVISALSYLGQKNTSLKVLQQIKNLVGLEKFQQILQAVQYMPGWMANLFYRYQRELNGNTQK